MTKWLKYLQIPLLLLACLFPHTVLAQIPDSLGTEESQTQEIRNQLDSLYIQEIQQANPSQKPKVLHAEPLFIDLIRDLGARKGEKEWNLGMELSDKKDIRAYHGLIEYEWAPINRLGLEVELPFSFYTTQSPELKDSLPASQLESFKMAAQYSF